MFYNENQTDWIRDKWWKRDSMSTFWTFVKRIPASKLRKMCVIEPLIRLQISFCFRLKKNNQQQFCFCVPAQKANEMGSFFFAWSAVIHRVTVRTFSKMKCKKNTRRKSLSKQEKKSTLLRPMQLTCIKKGFTVRFS